MLETAGQDDIVDERWEIMRKKMVVVLVLLLAVLFLVPYSAEASRSVHELIRAGESINLNAQAFIVQWRVSTSPSKAVPLIARAKAAADTMPDGQTWTEEGRDVTTVAISCHVYPDKKNVRLALTRMKDAIGSSGESNLCLVGQSARAADDGLLKVLLSTLDDELQMEITQRNKRIFAGQAYEVGYRKDSGRAQVAIARPHIQWDN